MTARSSIYMPKLYLIYIRVIFIVVVSPVTIETQFIIQDLVYCFQYKVVSSNPVHGEVYSIQHYVIKFVSDLWQVCGFLWALQFPPPIKLTAAI
jgi:hypothetical protein